MIKDSPRRFLRKAQFQKARMIVILDYAGINSIFWREPGNPLLRLIGDLNRKYSPYMRDLVATADLEPEKMRDAGLYFKNYTYEKDIKTFKEMQSPSFLKKWNRAGSQLFVICFSDEDLR